MLASDLFLHVFIDKICLSLKFSLCVLGDVIPVFHCMGPPVQSYLFHCLSSNQEHRDLTDNAWQKLTGMVNDGEGLLKEAKELLRGWPLPPVGSVQMGSGEMEALGRCSKGIKVSSQQTWVLTEPS